MLKYTFGTGLSSRKINMVYNRVVQTPYVSHIIYALEFMILVTVDSTLLKNNEMTGDMRWLAIDLRDL